MKHSNLIYAIFFLLLPHAISAQITESIDKLAIDESKAYKSTDQSLFSNAPTLDYSINYQELYFEINPAYLFIKGHVKTVFFSRENNLDHIAFDCSHFLTIDSVVSGTHQLDYTLNDNDVLTIALSKKLSIHQVDTLSVFYHGVPQSSGLGSFQQTFHNSVPSIWTLSEPFGARDWWPCKQQLEDKIDSLDIVVKTPKGNMVGSNGRLIKVDTLVTDLIFHWHSNYPMATYLVGVAVTNYVMFTDTMYFAHDTVPIINLVYPEKLEEEKLANINFKDNIHLYDSLLIPYPFAKEKYGHAQFGWGGGMEHQTMSFVSHLDFELAAHEMAHQWFGDRITCANWRDIWLNEGFATYMTGVSYEHTYQGAFWMQWKKVVLNNIVSKPGGSIYIYDDSTNVSRIFDGRLSYAKGAFLLHMLRWKFGDIVFFQTLKNYLNDTSLAYQFATTDDFKKHFESATGQNLDEFFNDWFYHEGYPTYHVTWRQNASNLVNIIVRQTQSNPSVDFFEMPIPIYFKNNEQDTTLVLNNTVNNQEFNIQLPFTIDSSTFDPERWLISAQNTIINLDDELKADNLVIKSAPNPLDKVLNIDITTEKPGKASIRLCDESGRLMVTKNVELFYGLNQFSFDVSTFASGYYALFVKANNDSYQRNFLKQ
jgi:aminopeptidase N